MCRFCEDLLMYTRFGDSGPLRKPIISARNLKSFEKASGISSGGLFRIKSENVTIKVLPAQ